MRLAIISDTHLPRGGRTLPEACLARLRAADAILHAGDLVEMSVLEQLRRLGPPAWAVHGNVDRRDVVAALPERRVAEVAGARIGMVHDAGPARGRLARQRAAFAGCDAVVFGHSLAATVTDPDAQVVDHHASARHELSHPATHTARGSGAQGASSANANSPRA